MARLTRLSDYAPQLAAQGRELVEAGHSTADPQRLNAQGFRRPSAAPASPRTRLMGRRQRMNLQ
jgi:hypothetical protein